ncbi:MAG: hypothetical protein HN509_10030 [Halobacteriovoraceae bacterium]|jgi:flagellar biosynthesis protein FlhF|nr:hypothetical protein [Halobacteriovoraceae bacterium]MBT5096045.1 hypothetical protein [Halobacteriovoraceae bacterium]
MYVRKFEAENLDDALKEIKREMGPDAIILKTITNKGLKGAFKKNKIEITAAISEKNYTKKARVDKVLDDDQKSEFYAGSSNYISNMIDEHSGNNDSDQLYQVNNPGYGSLGLNKSVNTVKKIGEKIKTGLDDFLNTTSSIEPDSQLETGLDSFITNEELEEFAPTQITHAPIHLDPVVEQPQVAAPPSRQDDEKINELERKIYELTKSLERIQSKEPIGVATLGATLRSHGIDESYIQEICKKAMFELSEEERTNTDLVFEFALREMLKVIEIDMPLFSTIDCEETPVITVLLSETSTGQTNLSQKIGALKKEAVIIRTGTADSQPNFAEQLLDVKVVFANSVPEIVSECRKAIEKGLSVFIDYKNVQAEENQAKKFIDGLRRAFDKVEVLVTLSAIHSEGYNKKVITRYLPMLDGAVVSHLDICLDFGALFNISFISKGIPFKFFGTGKIIPEDIESATAERVLAGIFNL